MKIYIDFDGVILDTDAIIDKEYSDNKNISRSDFVKSYNWEELLIKSDIINNSIDNLLNTKYEINILSKISSMNEGISKVKYLREKGVMANIYLVPNVLAKSDIVCAKGNILIDDKVYNLDDWNKKGGIAIFFNKNNENVDIKGAENKIYRKICSLELLLNEELEKISSTSK